MTSAEWQQYRAVKAKHEHCVLMYRQGNSYGVFDGDAEVIQDVIGMALVPYVVDGESMVNLMAVVPMNESDQVIRRLVKAGHRVALCDVLQGG